jgi:hypothetical protein
MVRNRFFKNTLGIQAEAIVAQFIDNSSPGASNSHKIFVANALPGAIAVYFSDTNLLVPTGGTSLAANANRKFFYAWKQADGTPFRTTDIPCLPTYKQVAYAAGTAQTSTVTVTGTVSTTQILHVRITDMTPAQVPYPTYDYQSTVSVDVATSLTAIAAAITAEVNEPIATATSNSTVLTIVGAYTNRTFTVTAWLELSPSQAVDASIFTIANTVKAVAPVGTTADVKEFETYFIEQQGGVLYPQEGTHASEFQTIGTAASSNVLTTINYGYLIVSTIKHVTDSGSTRDYSNKSYVIVALPTASVATLAAN